MTAVTVHLVDDDESWLRALARMLAAEGFPVQAFPSGAALLAGVGRESRGCIVADLQMPGLDGIQLQAELARAEVRLPIVFLSGHGDIPQSVRAMKQGAVDFLVKQAPREEVVAAVRRALERDVAESGLRVRQDELKRRFARLTRREQEVLGGVVRGLMNKQIAARLGISERTVKMHRTSITGKVGVHSAAQLATLAQEAGLFAQQAPGDAAAPTPRSH
jgi:FixJ family two-component response regulator